MSGRRAFRRIVVTGALIGLPLVAVTGTAMADPVHHDGSDQGQDWQHNQDGQYNQNGQRDRDWNRDQGGNQGWQQGGGQGWQQNAPDWWNTFGQGPDQAPQFQLPQLPQQQLPFFGS